MSTIHRKYLARTQRESARTLEGLLQLERLRGLAGEAVGQVGPPRAHGAAVLQGAARAEAGHRADALLVLAHRCLLQQVHRACAHTNTRL